MGLLSRFGVLVTLLLLVAGCAGNAASGPAAGNAIPAVHQSNGDALAEIQGAAAPAGVDAAVWEQLKAELARVVGARASLPVIPRHSPAGTRALLKTTSAPPVNAESAPQLSYITASSTLGWGYFNSGDYDQNGEVNVADLTPLGLHFGEVGPFAPDSAQSVIDGDGNGEINLADVTQIGLNFGRRVEGYRVYVADSVSGYPAEGSAPNGAGVSLVDSVPLARASAGTARRWLTTQVVPTEYKQYYWVRPYDGDSDGTASNAVEVVAPPNQPPSAKLGTPFGGNTMAHVTWNAGQSSDIDGSIASFAWDFNDDGVFEYDSGTQPTAVFYYYLPGSFPATVRVTDDDGASATAHASVEIALRQQWHATQLPADVGNISPHSLADVQGRPALSAIHLQYPEAEPNFVPIYIRAADAHGTAWGSAVVLDGPLPEATCLAVAGDRPVAAWTEYNTYPRACFFQRANDNLGSSWNASVPVDGEGTISEIMYLAGSMVIVRDSVYIISRADDENGSSWTTVSTEPVSIYAAGLGIVNGMLGVAYTGSAAEELKYRNAEDQFGAAWSLSTVVDCISTTSLPEMVGCQGRPGIAYGDATYREIRFVGALNAAGSAWGKPVTLDKGTLMPSRLFIADGRPAVFYMNDLTHEIRFVAANNLEGTSWGLPMAITPEGAAEPLKCGSDELTDHASCGEIAGSPALAFALYQGPGPQVDYPGVMYASYW